MFNLLLFTYGSVGKSQNSQNQKRFFLRNNGKFDKTYYR